MISFKVEANSLEEAVMHHVPIQLSKLAEKYARATAKEARQNARENMNLKSPWIDKGFLIAKKRQPIHETNSITIEQYRVYHKARMMWKQAGNDVLSKRRRLAMPTKYARKLPLSKRRPYEVLNRHDFYQVDEGKALGIFEKLDSGATRQWYFFNDVHTYDDKIEFEVASERGLKRVMKLGFHDVFKIIGNLI